MPDDGKNEGVAADHEQRRDDAPQEAERGLLQDPHDVAPQQLDQQFAIGENLLYPEIPSPAVRGGTYRHGDTAPASSRNRRRIANPTAPLFSGWNCTP